MDAEIWRRWPVLVVAATMALALAMVVLVPGTGQAQPQSFNVQLDAPGPAGEMWGFMAFFPHYLAVHQGDTVEFDWGGLGGPHTVTLVPSPNAKQWRSDHQSLDGDYQTFVPDTAVGGDDAGLVLNPLVGTPSFALASAPPCGVGGAPACSFDGSAVVNSGVQEADPSNEPSFAVQIANGTPPGEYTVLCLLHPGMEMNLYVLPASSTIESPDQVSARAAAEIQHALTVDGPAADRVAQSVRHHHMANGHTRWTIHAGAVVGQVSADEFLDDPLVVHRGDRITVLGSHEIHNMAFPIGKVKDRPLLLMQCEVPGPDPAATGPGDCASPQQFEVAFNPQVVDGTGSHALKGHQVVNSGIMARPSTIDGMELPFRTRFTFVARRPGVYHGMCNVHGINMNITIRVLA